MTRSWRAGARLAATATALLLLTVLACGEEKLDSTPTAQDTLETAADRMASLISLSFTLVHEQGLTPLMAGIQAQGAQGVVALPDRASLEVDAIVTGLGVFVSLKILLEEGQATMTDPLTGTPRELPADSLPFNFLNLGMTLADIARTLQEPVYTTEQEVGGMISRGVRGTVLGQDIRTLIPSAMSEAQVGLELWVGVDNLIRRVRIAGPVIPQDTPDVVRVLTLGDFDQPVSIPPLM